MNHLRPCVYYTEHPLSKTVSKAVLAGTRGYASLPVDLQPGPAICYGILRGCGDIIRRCYNSSRDFYHIDHGYLNRVDWGNTQSLSYGHFRVTKNALSMFDVHERHCVHPARLKALNLQLKPFNTGSKIVVCGITDVWATNHPWLKIDKDEFLRDTVNTIRSVTDRDIVVKDKNVGRLSDLLNDAHCVVCHSSNAAVEALLHGVPVIALGESIASGMCGPLIGIEGVSLISPVEYEFKRSVILAHAANNQYTLQELADEGTWASILGSGVWDGRTTRSLR